MAKEDKSQNTTAEMFTELFLYAPIGLLYEYKDSMPELIKRGKSQVQLTKLLGQMAANKAKGEAKSSAESVLSDTASFLRTVASRLESLDHASCCESPCGETATTADKAKSTVQDDAAASSKTSEQETTSLPIDGYDTLAAREIIQRLSSLQTDELSQILQHEKSNKARKTVLAEIDRLLAL